ncbi:class II aldolase/adducin family protein, partial [bacterium]
HIAIYNKRTDINAVVHIHGPYAVALTVAGIPFRSDILPEIPLKFGEIPTTDYATPSTPRAAEVLKPYLNNEIRGAILPYHGIVALGKTVEKALLVAEGIEYAAKVQVLASAIGEPKQYPNDII